MRDWIIVNARPSMRQIAQSVAEAHGLPAAELYTHNRQKWVSHPRQEAMARMSDAGFSHTQIVRHFGFENHTTSVHAKNAVALRGLDYRVPKSKWTLAVIRARARAARAQRRAA